MKVGWSDSTPCPSPLAVHKYVSLSIVKPLTLNFGHMGPHEIWMRMKVKTISPK